MNVKRLGSEWKNISTIVVYGMGAVADRFLDKILQDFQVPYIIDYKKQGKKYHDIPVISYEMLRENIRQEKYKIVVMTSQRVYSEIKRILEADNFVEMEDFCRIELFAIEWYRANRNMMNILQVNTAVTTWCTLNCEKCNMFMPYYGERKHYTLTEMKEDIDILLKYVDYTFLYSFLGGEPFLNKDLKNIISYIGDTYSDRIGKLGITTNGTVVPDDETLYQIKKYQVTVNISDYTAVVPYQEKLDRLIDVLKKWEIAYIRNHMTEWKDFGFPNKPFHWGKEGGHDHMKSCSPLFHGINDKKFYYCHVIWSADKAGIYTAPESDYIDLTELEPDNEADKKKVWRYALGDCERGFLGFCMVCGGCGEDNDKAVVAGIQSKKM